jgi:hypothetical protein
MSSQLQVTGEAKIRDIQGPVVANSGVITALDGAASQYVRGDGTLADFPTSSGGGSSVSYYLNSSVSQGTIGGVAYRELSKDPIIGAGTDIAISANGYVANYITDANDPDVVIVPGGNFNCEFYFSVNNNTGNPFTYAELYKYDGTTFTLLGSSVGVPEYINQGTVINPYYFAIPVATATLALTDRLAIRIYVNVDGRTVTLHTENGHLCQVVTTLSKGMVSLNNLTDQSQFLAVGTSGTNFAIVSSGDTHTFNLPIASATNTGKLSSTDWSTFNNKQNALTNPITGTGANGQVTYFNGTTSVTSTSNLFWDNANNFLGVGTNAPNAGVTSFSTTPAFQFKAAGVAPAITFSDTLTSASLACVFGLATSNNQFVFGTASGDMAIANQSTSAGAIVFGTGTTERMRMTSAGTLSIGNTNSTYKLDVTGTVRFTGELTGSSAVFSSTVRPSSSFGADLGTSSFRWNDIYGFSLTLTSSVTALSIIKSGGTSSQFLKADGSVDSNTYLTTSSASSTYLPLTGGTLTGALSGTSATFSGLLTINVPTDNTTVGIFHAGGGTANRGLKISTFAATNDNAGVTLDAQTSTGVLAFATAGAEKMRITSAGNVGIGTSSPTNSGGYATLTIGGNSTTKGQLTFNSSTTPIGYLYNDATNMNIGSENALIFATNSTAVERMRITSGGDLGIGTSTINYATANRKVVEINGTSTALLAFKTGDVAKSYLFQTGTDFIMTNLAAAGGNFAFENNGAERMRINPNGIITINNLAAAGSRAVLADSSGNLSAPVSDISVKENIKPIGYGLNEILKMNPVWFDFIDEYKNYGEGRQNGNIAQEMEAIIPEAVFVTPSTGKMGINYDQLHAVYIKAIQELKAEIEILKNK